jgi:hypothetical protein
MSFTLMNVYKYALTILRANDVKGRRKGKYIMQLMGGDGINGGAVYVLG